MIKRKLIEIIASGILNNNTHLLKQCENYLPSGSGIGTGTKINLDSSFVSLKTCKNQKITLTFSYHRMDSNGFYCGWFDYTVKIYPSFFDSYQIFITCSTKHNDPSDKEYFYDLFYSFLNEEYEQIYNSSDSTFTIERIKS